MLRCIKLTPCTVHDSDKVYGSIHYSAQDQFNMWDQSNVKAIHTITTSFNQMGTTTEITVFYEPKEN